MDDFSASTGVEAGAAKISSPRVHGLVCSLHPMAWHGVAPESPLSITYHMKYSYPESEIRINSRT